MGGGGLAGGVEAEGGRQSRGGVGDHLAEEGGAEAVALVGLVDVEAFELGGVVREAAEGDGGDEGGERLWGEKTRPLKRARRDLGREVEWGAGWGWRRAQKELAAGGLVVGGDVAEVVVPWCWGRSGSRGW